MRCLIYAIVILVGCGARVSDPACRQRYADCTDACGAVCERDGVPGDNGGPERVNTWSLECKACAERCRAEASRCDTRADSRLDPP